MDDYGNELHFADQWHGLTTHGLYGYNAHDGLYGQLDFNELSWPW